MARIPLNFSSCCGNWRKATPAPPLPPKNQRKKYDCAASGPPSTTDSGSTRNDAVEEAYPPFFVVNELGSMNAAELESKAAIANNRSINIVMDGVGVVGRWFRR